MELTFKNILDRKNVCVSVVIGYDQCTFIRLFYDTYINFSCKFKYK